MDQVIYGEPSGCEWKDDYILLDEFEINVPWWTGEKTVFQIGGNKEKKEFIVNINGDENLGVFHSERETFIALIEYFAHESRMQKEKIKTIGDICDKD